MATWYWVAATAANFATNNWATSSGGTATGQPTTTDTAIFDGGSSATCTIAAAATLVALDCQGGTGPFTGSLLHSAFTVTLTGTTGNVLRLSSGMTYTPSATTSIFAFTNTTGTANLTSAGQQLGSVTRSGIGGTTQLQDAAQFNDVANAILLLTGGTLDCNGKALTTATFTSSGASARALLLGSTWTACSGSTGNQTPINITATGFTLTNNSCTMTIAAPTAALAGINLTFGGMSFPPLTFAPNSIGGSIASMGGGATFASLTLNSGWINYIGTGVWNINAPFTWTGTAVNPVCLMSVGFNTGTTVNVTGTNQVTWGILNFSPVGGTCIATNCLVMQTTNWTIQSPADVTAIPAAAAAAVWTDSLGGNDFSVGGSIGSFMIALSNLQYTVQAIGRGVANAGASTTSIPSSSFTPAGGVLNQFAGRVILFDGNTATAALRGQATIISGSTNASFPTFTVTALTTAPASGDTFSVI